MISLITIYNDGNSHNPAALNNSGTAFEAKCQKRKTKFMAPQLKLRRVYIQSI